VRLLPVFGNDPSSPGSTVLVPHAVSTTSVDADNV